MFPAARLKILQQRKQELLCESEVQRRLLTLECAAVGQRLEWLNSAVNVARRVAPFLGLAAPLWQTWSARRNGERGWLGRITNALPLARRFAGAVQQFIQR
jgi:hypothetical protein